MESKRDGSLHSDKGVGGLHVRRRAKSWCDEKRKGRDRTGGMKIVGGRGTAILGKRSSLCPTKTSYVMSLVRARDERRQAGGQREARGPYQCDGRRQLANSR